MNPTFVFDGDCAFCTTCASFVDRRIPTDATVVAWQRADLAVLGVTRQQCLEAVQWVTAGQPTLAGPDAIGALLRSSTRWWWRPLGTMLRIPPVRAAAWPIYRWVAHNRHRLPGGTAACAVPITHAGAHG